jgi:hypothetical protein
MIVSAWRFWEDIAKAMGIEDHWDPMHTELNRQRIASGFLPARVESVETVAGRAAPAGSLYEMSCGYGASSYYLRPEFADLRWNNPYRAPPDLERLYLEMVIRRQSAAA